MSFSNSGQNPVEVASVSTVVPDHQEKLNYGFQGIYDPPPTYDDVIRGVYSVRNNVAMAPPPPQPEPSIQEDTKSKTHDRNWVFLGVLIGVVLVIFLLYK